MAPAGVVHRAEPGASDGAVNARPRSLLGKRLIVPGAHRHGRLAVGHDERGTDDPDRAGGGVADEREAVADLAVLEHAERVAPAGQRGDRGPQRPAVGRAAGGRARDVAEREANHDDQGHDGQRAPHRRGLPRRVPLGGAAWTRQWVARRQAPPPSDSHRNVRMATSRPAMPHAAITVRSTAVMPVEPGTRKAVCSPCATCSGGNTLPTSTSHVGMMATGTNTPEMNDRTTVENGPNAEAASVVVQTFVAARPSALKHAVPTRT